MKNIHKFIIHVTNNLFPLNEYSEGEIRRLMNKFKEEADDLNINITDEQLKAYIERFDQLKNSPKITEKDLRKYSLSQLIKLITTYKGGEIPDSVDTTPDVVYDQDGLIIYNGSRENNCLNFGRGERWCITRGSYFGNYRYNKERKYATFYLVKDTNLPPSDRKSFFVVVVGEDNTYKASDRSNNDVGGRATEWDRWEPWSFIESNFPSVTGLRSIFKYIPLSSNEKVNQRYAKEAIGIREWLKLPYSVKEQYLVIRKDKGLFSDITNDEFVSKYLVKIPQLAEFVALNNGVVRDDVLLKYLDKFSNQDQKSIMANMRTPFPLSNINTDNIPFESKKLITQLNKWALTSNQQIYVTKDGKAIVLLTISDDNIIMGIYTEEDDYPNVKLNSRTSKYLLDYPEIDNIPFKTLLNLNNSGIVGKEFINKTLEKIKEDPNSSMVIKDIDGGQVLLDSNSFVSYKIEGDKFTQVPFDDEDIQKTFEEENDSLQQSAVDIIERSVEKREPLPPTLDKSGFFSVLNSIPYNKRKILGDRYIIIVSPNNIRTIFTGSPLVLSFSAFGYTGTDWRKLQINPSINSIEIYEAYFDYLRNENQSYPEAQLISFLKNTNIEVYKKMFLEANPPLDANNKFRIVVNPDQDEYLLVNTADPKDSRALSPSTGKLVKANIPPRKAAELLRGQTPPPTPTTTQTPQQPTPEVPTVRRRGRPAGVRRNMDRVENPPQQVNTNRVEEILQQYQLERSWRTLSTSIKNRFSIPSLSNIRGDRGASRRDNLLGGRGRVIQIISSGNNKMYIIRLNNGTHVASIVLQPGNAHLLLLPNRALNIGTPDNLMGNLRQNDLAESHKGLAVKMYLSENPTMLEETKELLRKHLNK